MDENVFRVLYGIVVLSIAYAVIVTLGVAYGQYKKRRDYFAKRDKQLARLVEEVEKRNGTTR